MPCNCKPHFHNRTYLFQSTILKNFPSSSQSLSSQKPKIRLYDNIILTFVSLWLYVSHCEGERERERELKPDIAEPCFSKFLPPSKWGFSFIFITIRTSAVWYLQLSEQANPMKVLKMTQSYYDSVPLPHALSSQMSKKYQSLNCSQGAFFNQAANVSISTPFVCTVHFYLQCLPSFQSKPPLQLSLLQENQVNHIKIESFTTMPLY